MIGWLEIIVLSVVEGITEFLPISSTGHLIIFKKLLNINESEQLNAFLVIVQSGAILAVVSVFFPVLLKWFKSWLSLLQKSDIKSAIDVKHRQQSVGVALSVLPFAVVGFLNKDFIKSLFSVKVVAVALIVGGILIVVDEYFLRRFRKSERDMSSLTIRDTFLVGVGQCLALWPGFSRSAATILTGRWLGFSRSASAEIGFLIGLPALLGTALYETIKVYKQLDAQWIQFLIVGIIISWGVAYVCVKSFIKFLNRYPLTIFAAYRILVGTAILVFL